jgi:L-cysteine desulfidase
MSGADVEIMSVAGSGNQGIVATLPIVAIAEHNQRQDGSLLRAVTLSALITIYVTHSVGYLTALCGCIMKAGLGATAGCAYLIERDVGAIEDAIHNMAGNVVGALCDGAKSGCSFKLATSAATAIECAMLAQSGVFIPAGQGIVADSAERSIHSLGKLSRSMQNTDRTIIAILEEFHQGRR